MEPERKINCVLIGESTVGKTALLVRFLEGTFQTTKTTIGIDFRIKHVELNGSSIQLNIWDTAGQERFRSITKAYFRGAQIICLIYDVSDRKSFEAIHYWHRQIAQVQQKPMILIGNKCDTFITVSPSEGQALADQLHIPFILTSAKHNYNVEALFEQVCMLAEKLPIKTVPPKSKRKCCVF